MPAVRATFSVSVRSNIASLVRTKIRDNMRAAVDASALNIQTRASQTAPRDTGSLAESIYHNNGTDSDYTSRTAQARSLNHDVVILDEIDPEFVISLSTGDDNGYVVVVGAAASHGIFQEYGTRFMRSSPFMTPAALGEQSTFENAMSHVAG